MLDAINVTVVSKHVDAEANTVFTLAVAEEDTATLEPTTVRFIQTESATEQGIAILPYGGVIFGGNVTGFDAYVELTAEIKGTRYLNAVTRLTPSTNVGAEFELSSVVDEDDSSSDTETTT